MMDLSLLIKDVVFSYQNAYRREISKTKLLKLTYLVEVEHYRRQSERLTNAEWKYYLYGPYIFGYDEILGQEEFKTSHLELVDEKAAELISLRTQQSKSDIDPSIHFLVTKIVIEYGKFDLAKLLDYVYFETEPMLNAEVRLEILDFSKILPEEYYSIRELHIDSKKEKELRVEFKKRLEVVRGKRI